MCTDLPRTAFRPFGKVFLPYSHPSMLSGSGYLFTVPGYYCCCYSVDENFCQHRHCTLGRGVFQGGSVASWIEVSVSLGPCSQAELWHPLGIAIVVLQTSATPNARACLFPSGGTNFWHEFWQPEAHRSTVLPYPWRNPFAKWYDGDDEDDGPVLRIRTEICGFSTERSVGRCNVSRVLPCKCWEDEMGEGAWMVIVFGKLFSPFAPRARR